MDFWSGPWPVVPIGLIFVAVVLRALMIANRISKKRQKEDEGRRSGK
ncbi:MAG: hypothetical protein WCP58_02005 [bacterium]